MRNDDKSQINSNVNVVVSGDSYDDDVDDDDDVCFGLRLIFFGRSVTHPFRWRRWTSLWFLFGYCKIIR